MRESNFVINYNSSGVRGFVPVGYVAPVDLTYDEWVSAGEVIKRIDRFKNFAIGDWLIVGERRFGEMYSQAMDEFEWGDYNKLTKLVWVARNVQSSNRRAELTWTHHHNVANLPTDEQGEWLDHAVAKKLSASELKDAIRASKQIAAVAPDDEDPPFANPERNPLYTNGTNSHSGDLVRSETRFTPARPFGELEAMADEAEGDEDGYDWQDTEDTYTTPQITMEQTASKPHVAHNSGNNEWYTPEEYIKAARQVLGRVDLDPATSEIANTVVQADEFYTAQDNGLDQEWTGKVWMNPPYSSDLVGRFAEKLCCHYEAGDVTEAIVLVNNATETGWFQRMAQTAACVCFPRTRVKFWKPDGETGAPLQGQAILYFGTKKTSFVSAFRSFGFVGVINE